jgi:hypothetical protein
LFPALVGILSAHLPLGTAIGIYTAGAYGLAIVALLFLPETQGRRIVIDERSTPSSDLAIALPAVAAGH